jgi:signal transduction histidine kinase
MALGASLTLYITSYLQVNNAFEKFAREHNVDMEVLLGSSTSFNIFVLSILVSLVVVLLLVIYLYYTKMIRLYKMQQNFIHGFTHELKTPVTSIKLYLDTMAVHEFPRQEQLKYIEFMKRDTDRLSDNISNILYFARLENRKLDANFTTIDPEAVIRSVIVKAHHIFEHATIEIENEKVGTIDADKALFETLVMNLLVNSITYTKKDSPFFNLPNTLGVFKSGVFK